MKLPDLALPATSGPAVNLGKLEGRAVLYIYPRTGVPGVDLPEGWNENPVRAAARRSPADFAITSPISRRWASRRSSVYRRRTASISAKPPSACICRLSSSPMPSSS